MEDDKLFNLIEKMYIELQELRKEVKSNVQDVQELRADIKSNIEKVCSIEETVMGIEQGHARKLEALLVGYRQNSEQLASIEKEVSKHEEIILRRVK